MQIACRSTGDACILTLARGVYNDMLTDYPEQQEAIVSNILANYGFDSKGNPLPGWTSDAGDDDEIYAQLRQMVLEAVMRQQDDLTNQFTYAVNQGEVDQVKTLIRKGANVDTDNYDHSR